jgi:hypothetical protein
MTPITNRHRHGSRAALLFGALLTVAAPAWAGPRLICEPFDAGNAAVLPWGTGRGWNTPDRSYDGRNLVADTLRLLSSDAPVLARMENMRRATIYAARDPQLAAALLEAVISRTKETPTQLALFDAGYLIETYRHASHAFKWEMIDGARSRWAFKNEPQLDGYMLVRKALQLGSVPEMEFAASLMGGAGADEHLRRATAGAPSGSLLAKNLTR